MECVYNSIYIYANTQLKSGSLYKLTQMESAQSAAILRSNILGQIS